jgi:glycine/D-amino acid oxidase-like deaminating enzyme
VTTTSYWLAEARAPLARRCLPGPADVVVVGGGVTGCSCALALAERGLRVRLLEAREVAGGASGRNAGFALRGAAVSYDEARRMLGPDRARALWRLTEVTLGRLERLAGTAFRRVGSIRLAADAAEREQLEREHDALRADGFAVERLGSLPAPLSLDHAGGLLHPGDGTLQPARWVRALAARAVAAGAAVAEGVAVDAAECATLAAGAVVVAADGATSRLVPALAEQVWPVRGQVLVTAPIAARLCERPCYARNGYDYWRQLPDGRLVVGGRRDLDQVRENTDVEETTPAIQRELEALAGRLAGQRVTVTHRWAGIWGETRDRLPLVGRVPGESRVWVAAGYSGHGNVLGLACGELLARAVAGEDVPELTLFDPARPRLSESPGR